jgi:Mn-dependent DtxR family transcriptional regulator
VTVRFQDVAVVLYRLARAAEPLGVDELARTLRVSPPLATAFVNELIEKGLVEVDATTNGYRATSSGLAVAVTVESNYRASVVRAQEPFRTFTGYLPPMNIDVA